MDVKKVNISCSISLLLLMVLLATAIFFIVTRPLKSKRDVPVTITTEIMEVDNHRYIVFRDSYSVLHIEHSPDCECFIIEYD